MKKTIKHVEIAVSPDKNLPSMSHNTAQAVKKILEDSGMHASICILDEYSDIESLAERAPDLVFIGMKRLLVGDEYVSVSEYLENRAIRITGSDAKAMNLELNKIEAKEVVAASDIKTAKFNKAIKGLNYDKSVMSLTFPLFVKPSNRGGGFGINENSVVRNFDELNSRIKDLDGDGFSEILIEEYLDGREFSIAILEGSKGEQCQIIPIEIVPPKNTKGDRILGVETKHADTEETRVVERGELRDELTDFSQNVFKALGGRYHGRVDVRMSGNGTPHFLEVNLMPGLSERGYFSRSLRMGAKSSYEETILSIAELALKGEVKKC